ncbi:MAG: 2,3-bisphosphoglycerate-independent phosphoglycerate mutase [Dehalococcoidia bacterium]
MIDLPYLNIVTRNTDSKIIFLVIDGLGGYPDKTGKSELEKAEIPNLDNLVKKSDCGLTIPVSHGITPGSGPGHLSLFGYDPVKYLLGRGVLETLGIDIDLKPNEIAARGNFCTVDNNGYIIDRRANRIHTNISSKIVKELQNIKIPGIEFKIYSVKDHRFVLIMNGDNLSPEISETDPQLPGLKPLEVRPLSNDSNATASMINKFLNEAKTILSPRETANMILLRGFSKLPNLPNFNLNYKLNACAIAAYPMYRGLSKLLGMDVLNTGDTFDKEIETLKENFNKYNFFFLHYKPADAAGEDGDFDKKVKTLEDLDKVIPIIKDIGADVLVIAGDHSTPAILGSHSWHPVPLMIHTNNSTNNNVKQFTEKDLIHGNLGTFHATKLMMLSLANAGKLNKYGP